MNAEAHTGTACIAPEDDGARLDAALARLLPLLNQSYQSNRSNQSNRSPDDAHPPLLPPGAGLRARRRLWLTHAVLLDGRPAQPGTRVRTGQRVALRPLDAMRATMQTAALPAGPQAGQNATQDTLRSGAAPTGNATGNVADAPHVLAETDGLVALYKPGGLHSAAVAGSAAPSVEALLPTLLGQPDMTALADHADPADLPGLTDLADPAALTDLAAPDASRPSPVADDTTGFPRLLNRLDGPTSGILLAARAPQAAQRFHAAENSGQATKTYIALVHGVLAQPMKVRRGLDTANRATTRVLPQDTPDALRHTMVTPLGIMQTTDIPDAAPCTPTLAGDAGQDSAPASACTTHAPGPACTSGTPCTLVRCVIRKGARHQIRAHLAVLGHPIVGDTRYGTPDGAGATTMPQGAPHSARLPAPATLFLHHARIELPGFRAACPPPWLHLLPPELQEAARAAYRLDS
uniref:Pseudouridine synthase n=1 Tax=Nitratidesulfovibrio vulgaris (strain DSM 19637 / Miyazaki F) TaxID=883 RepID=B8DKC4_NITV9